METDGIPATRRTRLLALAGVVVIVACADAPTEEVGEARRLPVEFTEGFWVGAAGTAVRRAGVRLKTRCH